MAGRFQVSLPRLFSYFKQLFSRPVQVEVDGGRVGVLPLGFGGGVVKGAAGLVFGRRLPVVQNMFSLPSVAFMLQSDYG
jgi:hypothetical protein